MTESKTNLARASALAVVIAALLQACGGNVGGGNGSGGAGGVGAGGSGGAACGKATCASGEYCCSSACGICAPIGGACPAITCAMDGGSGTGGSGTGGSGGGIACGQNVCGSGEYCCHPECSMCGPMGALCVQCPGAGGAGGTGGGTPCGKTTCNASQQCCSAACSYCGVAGQACPPIDCMPDCTAQDAQPVGKCDVFFGYAWTGAGCKVIGGCSCAGADCGKLFQDEQSCLNAYGMCPMPL